MINYDDDYGFVIGLFKTKTIEQNKKHVLF